MDTTKHSTEVLAGKGESALAILLAGLVASNRLYDRYEDLERAEKAQDHHFPANYFERASKEQIDIYYELLDVMPYFPATNLIEAAAQVGQAMNVISMAYDQLPEEPKEAEACFQKMEKTVSRLLHSAIRVMERDGAFSLAAMGLESIRGANLDPWADIEAVVSDLQKQGVK
ncbi:hypothetical protein N8A98_22430 [Devosia neptuniae]|uniref:Uncharacterized protein n=1 Tax=Devosia neptuniae TaxID=191302 RepID=A0ABY6CCG8_9HYPH|nr:hypothetical protein [Devosia neptuniae]UXN69931.1 hypothetical protein N8A98_22430 [Devosia neptuniae]